MDVKSEQNLSQKLALARDSETGRDWHLYARRHRADSKRSRIGLGELFMDDGGLWIRNDGTALECMSSHVVVGHFTLRTCFPPFSTAEWCYLLEPIAVCFDIKCIFQASLKGGSKIQMVAATQCAYQLKI